MSLYDYRWSLEAGKNDPPFYGLLMAAIRKADTINCEKIRAMWPELWEEFRRRYNAPDGILPEDGPICGSCPVHGTGATDG